MPNKLSTSGRVVLKYSHFYEHYWFIVKARNNQILVTSETYPRRRNAVRGIVSLWANTGRGFTSYIDATGKELKEVAL